MMGRQVDDHSSIFENSDITVGEWKSIINEGIRDHRKQPFYCASCKNMERRTVMGYDSESDETLHIPMCWCNFMDDEVEPSYEELPVCRYEPKEGIKGVPLIYRLKLRWRVWREGS